MHFNRLLQIRPPKNYSREYYLVGAKEYRDEEGPNFAFPFQSLYVRDYSLNCAFRPTADVPRRADGTGR